MVCNYKKLKHTKIKIGDLDKRIILQLRTMPGNNYASVENIPSFTNIVEVWAGVESTRGTQLFDGVDVANAYTHNFYIRYRSDVDYTKWIDYDSNKYDIIDVEDLNNQKEFLVLRCILKGSNTKRGSYA